jgi:glycosyltransferase involved in cell wall biosynthesis
MSVPIRPRIVVFAYNFDPDSGSEGGVGWTWSQLLNGIGPVTVLVRERPGRRAAVEAALAALPRDRRARLVFVELPGWLQAVSRRRRSPRVEYLVWMRSALSVAQRLHSEVRFDLAWHLTWANAWIGTSASMVGVPFVLGPVGAGAGPPWRLVPILGTRGAMAELGRSALRTLGRHVNPLAHQAWRRASLVLAQNPETRDWLPASVRPRTVVMPNALFDHPPVVRAPRRPGDPPVALFAGRFLPWKGATLALRATARLPGWRLILCGDGAEAERLRREAARLNVEDRVEFRGWTPRSEVLRIMREEADVLAFPSLHDEGGWTVAEATMIGLPAVSLDRGGPQLLGGRPVRAGWPRETVDGFAEGLRSALGRTSATLAWPMDVDGRRVVVRALLEAIGLVAPGNAATAEQP